MKNFLAAIIFILVVFMGGCQSANQNKTVIKFASWGSQSEVAIIKPLIADFEKQNSDIKVEFLHIPQNYFQKIHLFFASNLPPDVIFINNYYAKKYIEAGLLEDLTPYFKEELGNSIFFEKAVQNFMLDNKLYAIPRDVSGLVVYYNKNAFDELGLDYPEQSWTISDFIETGKKLTNTNKQWGTGIERELLFMLPFLYSNGACVIDKEGKIALGKAVEPIQLYTDIVNKYHIAPTKAQTASLTLAQMFLQGKIAMHISGRWLVPKYRSDAKFDWDVINFPSGTSDSVTNIDSSGFAIAKNSKYKDADIKLIKYLTSKDAMEKFAKSGLIVPARKDAAYSNSFLDSSQKPVHAKIFLDAVEKGQPTGVNKNYQKINDILINGLEPVFEGKKTAKEVINNDFLNKLNHHKSVN